jgi:hypothetical protein
MCTAYARTQGILYAEISIHTYANMHGVSPSGGGVVVVYKWCSGGGVVVVMV